MKRGARDVGRQRHAATSGLPRRSATAAGSSATHALDHRITDHRHNVEQTGAKESEGRHGAEGSTKKIVIRGWTLMGGVEVKQA